MGWGGCGGGLCSGGGGGGGDCWAVQPARSLLPQTTTMNFLLLGKRCIIRPKCRTWYFWRPRRATHILCGLCPHSYSVLAVNFNLVIFCNSVVSAAAAAASEAGLTTATADRLFRHWLYMLFASLYLIAASHYSHSFNTITTGVFLLNKTKLKSIVARCSVLVVAGGGAQPITPW